MKRCIRARNKKTPTERGERNYIEGHIYLKRI